MGFIEQYDLLSLDFNLSRNKKRQDVNNLFHGEALRYYHVEVGPLGNNYVDAIEKIKSQLNSVSKQ